MAAYEYKIAVKNGEIESPFACSSCGHTAVVLLRARAEGTATVGATRADASVVAEQRAARGLEQQIARLRNIVPCPKCGTIDAVGLKRWRKGRLGAAALLAVCGLVGSTIPFMLGQTRLGWLIAVSFALCTTQPLLQVFRLPRLDVSFVPTPGQRGSDQKSAR